MTSHEIELIEQYVDGVLVEERMDDLRALLRESADARTMLRSLATIDFGLQDIAAREGEVVGQQPAFDALQASRPQNIEPAATMKFGQLPVTLLPTDQTKMSGYFTALHAIAAVIIVGLATGLFLQYMNHQRTLTTLATKTNKDIPIAKIRSMGGVVNWTGDGGTVTSELKVGTQLTGGTIESSSPTSWVELEFLDGTTATVSGDSRLTFSDFGQKILYLKKGSVTSKVKTQSSDSPMLVHTRTALLEVLGTEFNVGSDLDTTSLNVTKGKVRLKRLSDGKVVDVPANQRVVSTTGEELTPHLIPASVSHWRSQFQIDSDGVLGRLVPKTNTTDAKLRMVPYVHTTPQGESMAMFAAGLQILGKDEAIVELRPDSMIRVRGFVKQIGNVVFGVTVRKPNGDHGGNFMTFNPMLDPDSEGRFECILEANKLRLDPGFARTENDRTASPVNSIVEVFFCSTLNESAGLEITEVEIF